MTGMIRLYRITLGQLLGGQCRFYPSCSAYAEEAIRELGWVRGSALGIWRVARCNPFGAGGVDYPPRAHAPSRHVYDVDIVGAYDAVTHPDGIRGLAPRLDEVEASHCDRRGSQEVTS